MLSSLEGVMAIDIIMRAKKRRERLVEEINRLDAFLAMAAELAAVEDDHPDRSQTSPRQAARRGAGADTVVAALNIIRDLGPQHTRDLLPLIIARGIIVGGKSPIATLSARLSSSGKGIIEMVRGRWQAVEGNKSLVLGTAPEREESADHTVEGRSADSLNNQTKEDRYAAALA
jgi:hypothetical protein